MNKNKHETNKNKHEQGVDESDEQVQIKKILQELPPSSSFAGLKLNEADVNKNKER